MAEQRSYDDRDGTIWFDGKMVPWREANVHVLTHGLHYASSVFEGQRAYGGTIFKSRAHSERLIASGATIDMPLPWNFCWAGSTTNGSPCFPTASGS